MFALQRRPFCIFLLVLLFSGITHAGDCRKTDSICTDTTPVKQIDGVNVTISEVGGCWSWKDTYECITPNAVDYCSGIANTQGCWQVSTKCVETNFQGGCNREERVYRCDDTGLATPPNTVRLDNSYTIVQDTTTSACDAKDMRDCTLAEKVCTEGPATRVINGLAVYKDCWAWEQRYTCASKQTNNCQPLIDKGCTQTASACLSRLPSGACQNTELTYQCTEKGSVTSTTTCGTSYCVTDAKGNKNCFSSPDGADQDLAKTVVAMELARQAGVYREGEKIFRGVSEECRQQENSIATSCCDPQSGAKTNNAAMGGGIGMTLAMSGISNAASGLKHVASSYVFDYAFPRGYTEVAGTAATYASNGNAWSSVADLVEDSATSWSPSVGYMGFSLVSSSSAAAVGAWSSSSMFASYTVTSFGGSSIALTFNPATFVVALVAMYYQSVTACGEQEQQLSMHKGAHLCEKVETKCEGAILVTCKEKHCCYNSKLARIINEQGKPQLGKAKSDCSGFSPEELSQLDFSRIDFTEFINDVKQNITVPDTSALQSTVQQNTQSKIQNFYK